MSEIISKKNPGSDTFGYFYSDISDQGIPDPNIRSTAIYNNYLHILYGTIPNITADSAPKGAKINLSTFEIEEFTFAFNPAGSSDVYVNSGLENDCIDMPASNKGLLWGSNTMVTVVKTLVPYHGITLVKLDLDGNLTLRALGQIDPNTSILDIALDGDDLYISGKTAYDAVSFDHIWKIDLSTNDAIEGCPTDEYVVNSDMRGGQSMHFYSGSLYFVGGRYWDDSRQIVDDATDTYFAIQIANLNDPDSLNTLAVSSPVALPPVIGALPLVFEADKVHITYNPFIYTLDLTGGSVFKNSTPEVISGNSALLSSESIMFLDYTTGTIYFANEPSAELLIAYGALQFYDSTANDEEVEDDLYYSKVYNKLDDKKFISGSTFLLGGEKI